MDLEAYVDVVPWLLFMVIDRRSGLGLPWAAVAAAGCGGGIAAWSYWRDRRTPIGWVAVATFGPLAVIGLVANQPAQWFEPTVRSASVAVLAMAALVSLRHRPLSEAYTSERVPPPRRAESAFIRVNRRVTAGWAATAILVAASFGGDAFVASPVGLTVFDWVLPIVVIACAVRWVAVQWTAYLVWAEGLTAGVLAEPSLTSHRADLAPQAAPTDASAGSVTYLSSARGR